MMLAGSNSEPESAWAGGAAAVAPAMSAPTRAMTAPMLANSFFILAPPDQGVHARECMHSHETPYWTALHPEGAKRPRIGGPDTVPGRAQTTVRPAAAGPGRCPSPPGSRTARSPHAAREPRPGRRAAAAR